MPAALSRSAHQRRVGGQNPRFKPPNVSPRNKLKRTDSTASLPTPPGTEDLVLDDVAPPRRKMDAKKRKAYELEDPFAGPEASTSSPSARPAKKSRANLDLSDEEREGVGSPNSRHGVDDDDDPFAATKGQKGKRTRDERYRTLVYVFRGKRIAYEDPNDIVLPGESPFVHSGPKLLFPPAPSPSTSASAKPIAPSTPKQAPSTPEPNEDILLRTPVKAKAEYEGGSKTRSGRGYCPLPTPESRPRIRRSKRLQD